MYIQVIMSALIQSKSKVNNIMSHQLTLVQELGNMNQSIYFYSIIRFVNVNE